MTAPSLYGPLCFQDVNPARKASPIAPSLGFSHMQPLSCSPNCCNEGSRCWDRTPERSNPRKGGLLAPGSGRYSLSWWGRQGVRSALVCGIRSKRQQPFIASKPESRKHKLTPSYLFPPARPHLQKAPQYSKQCLNLVPSIQKYQPVGDIRSLNHCTCQWFRP